MLFRDRRSIKDPVVAAVAKSGAIKAIPKKKNKKMSEKQVNNYGR